MLLPQIAFRAILGQDGPQSWGDFREGQLASFSDVHDDPIWIFSTGHGSLSWAADSGSKRAYFQLSGGGTITSFSVARNYNLFAHRWFGGFVRLGAGVAKFDFSTDDRSRRYRHWLPIPDAGAGITLRPAVRWLNVQIGPGVHYAFEPLRLSLLVRF
jgi:hypothetical protein